MKQTKVNFNGVAVLCDSWQQMLHLADLARERGKITDEELFNEYSFNKDSCVWFTVIADTYGNYPFHSHHDTPIPYSTFINPPTDESVYGC